MTYTFKISNRLALLRRILLRHAIGLAIILPSSVLSQAAPAPVGVPAPFCPTIDPASGVALVVTRWCLVSTDRGILAAAVPIAAAAFLVVACAFLLRWVGPPAARALDAFIAYVSHDTSGSNAGL